MRKAILLPILLLAAAALLAPAQGTHEQDHRYYVSGQLTHPDGSPACGLAVEAGPDADGLLHRAVTDHTGSYRALLHFHNLPEEGVVDVGATFQVRVVETAAAKQATVVAGPSGDGWGESRVDFVVPAGMGDACPAPLVQTGLYVGVPVALLGGLGVAYVKVLRPWWRRRPRAPRLSSIPGIGSGRLRELRGLGVGNVEDLAAADPDELSQATSMSRREARRLVKRAQERLHGGT